MLARTGMNSNIKEQGPMRKTVYYHSLIGVMTCANLLDFSWLLGVRGNHNRN